ncbi:tyrosine-type recombinase/integrase, partial [Escherichia coli]|nr:tyrosine-type recombinase/integrase [Escherichia coli]
MRFVVFFNLLGVLIPIDELPKYLLSQEVSALLHYVPDLHRKMLLATLWNTGARINEA